MSVRKALLTSMGGAGCISPARAGATDARPSNTRARVLI